MSLRKLMGRVFLCKSLEANARNILYVKYYASPSFNSLIYLQGSTFRGHGRNIYIYAKPTPKSLPLKVNPGNPVEVGSFDIEARPAIDAPPTNAFHGITGHGKNIYISAKPTPKSLPLKVNPGNPVEVGTFDIEARPAIDAPPTNAFHGITGNLNTKNKVEEKAGGLDHDVMMQTAEHTDMMEWLARIKKGDVINLNDLLFTQNRDYLIRYNDDRQVKAEELADKVIAVYLVPLRAGCMEERMTTTHLIDTYNYLLPHNVFEVVLVAYETDLEELNSGPQTNPEERFEAMFSRMPWTAIPFSDITSRERLSRKFGIHRSDDSLDSFVIDSTGMVLQCDCAYYFRDFGGLGYPFSDGRILFLKSQDDALAEQQPSLKMLLASPERDYIISNKGDKVLIDTLEEKVVALYFYEEGKTLSRLTADIKLAYEEFAEKKNEFEVVLIYLYDTENTCGYTNEESFRKTFKSMPWLALPFKDPTYIKLKRLFGHNLDLGERVQTPSLVIFGPHGEFIEPWGADILMTFKLPAYPFTREKVAKLETEKIKELKLEMLWDRNTLFRKNDGTEVPLYELAGKRIILFFEGNEYQKHAAHFLNLLKNSYTCMKFMKGTDDEFEVIYITSGKEEALYRDMIFDVPWLFALKSELLPVDLSLYCCYCETQSLGELGCDCPPGWCGRNSTLLAFDRDGRLVRKSVYLDFDGIKFFDYADFLFDDADMEEEALLELSEHYAWLDLDQQYRGLSYALFSDY